MPLRRTRRVQGCGGFFRGRGAGNLGFHVRPIAGTGPKLRDALVNLLPNAADAMPEGGVITLCTRAGEKGVRITVRDTGIGMDEETRKRAFEPFFTTKMNVGSGLGLSTAYGTITRWGGTLEVESEPGRGTTFDIRLPAWTEGGPLDANP